MSILDKLSERSTGMHRYSDFGRSPITELKCEPTGEFLLDTPDRNEEFELSAKIGVRFWANRAQHSEARRIAEKVLLQRLYGETLALLEEATKEVYAGDASATIAVLNRIRRNLLGEGL